MVQEARTDAARGAETTSASAFARGLFTSRDALVTMVAVALANLVVLLMNRSLFPLFDDVFTYARDISITCSGLFCITVGLVSLVRPALLRGRVLMVGALAALLAGAAGMVAGLAWASPALLVAGSVLFVVARGWGMLVANLAAVRLPAPQALACIACGVAAGQVLDVPCRLLLPQVACVVVMALAALVSLVLVARPTARLVDEVAGAESAADVAVTRPASYLPLTHNLYVYLILAQVAFGFALRFGEVGGSPAFGSLAVPFVLAVAVLAVALRGRFFGDGLANVVMLSLIAGFLLVIVGLSSYAYLANGLLTVGTSLFGVLMYAVLVALAGRNRLASLSIMGWGVGLSSLATTFGALVGTTANRLLGSGDHQQLALLVGGVVLLLVAYILFGLRGFSFRETIAGVETPIPPVVPAQVSEASAGAPEAARESGEELFRARCHDLAARFGLTPREEETFSMLARGRNREYIEEHLCVSRNTVKAHVKHVYAKLGIHSHQELLDLVEG